MGKIFLIKNRKVPFIYYMRVQIKFTKLGEGLESQIETSEILNISKLVGLRETPWVLEHFCNLTDYEIKKANIKNKIDSITVDKLKNEAIFCTKIDLETYLNKIMILCLLRGLVAEDWENFVKHKLGIQPRSAQKMIAEAKSVQAFNLRYLKAKRHNITPVDINGISKILLVFPYKSFISEISLTKNPDICFVLFCNPTIHLCVGSKNPPYKLSNIGSIEALRRLIKHINNNPGQFLIKNETTGELVYEILETNKISYQIDKGLIGTFSISATIEKVGYNKEFSKRKNKKIEGQEISTPDNKPNNPTNLPSDDWVRATIKKIRNYKCLIQSRKFKIMDKQIKSVWLDQNFVGLSQ